MNLVDHLKKGLSSLPSEKICEFASYCKDDLALQKSIRNGEKLNEDLTEQHYEVCIHPSEETRQSSCIWYRNFKFAQKRELCGGLK